MWNNPLPTIATKVTPALRLKIAGGIFLTLVGVGGYRLTVPQPKVIFPTGPSLGVTQVSHTQPVTIVFSHPVKRSALQYAMHPELKGTWDLTTNFLAAQSTLQFTPTETPDLETRYTIELSGIQSYLGGQPKKYLLSFQTDTVPKFESVSPAKTSKDVMPDAAIEVTFDKPLSDNVVVTATLSPELELAAPTISENVVTFTHPELFQKSADYTLKIFLATSKLNYATQKSITSGEPEEISLTTFTTIAAPSIESYSPKESGVDPASAIQIEFKQAMDRPSTESAFKLAPSVTGSLTWTNDSILVFTPSQPLTKGQEYTVTLANTAKAISGFTTDENFTWSFSVIGLVTVSSFSPGNGATGVDTNANLSVTFNQAVDHPSAESKFSITPSTGGAFSWSSNTMTFDPGAPLAYNVTYTATVAKGVKSVQGLDSNADFSTRFGTRNPSVLLSVPAYPQAHVYSCMISAARSALAYRKINVSESAIISRVGIDPTQWSGTWGGENGGWGDPTTTIVGPLDNAAATSPAGKQTTNVYWGYGSHWEPISQLLTSYGVANDVVTGMTVQQLAQAVSDNNPVIIWWVNGIWPSYEVNWKTPGGKQIRGVNGLHVQVVRGFTGPVENPISFTVTDSGYGYPGRTFDIGTFKAKWGWFGNTGIVVK